MSDIARNLKFLIVGDWHSNIHEEACANALRELGHEVYDFSWYQYFQTKKANQFLTSLFLRFQHKFRIGPAIHSLNQKLLIDVKRIQPDVIFIYRGTHIFPKTLREIKHLSNRSVLVSYNNDDPFSRDYPGYFWRFFLKGLRFYDLHFVYRHHNIQDYEQRGLRNIHLLRSYFIRERNHPVILNGQDKEQYKCDVVFIGHCENDGRVEMLEKIAASGLKVRIFGYGWDDAIRNLPHLKACSPIRLVWDEEYNKALCGAKIALCFFSRLNRDTYTRRVFEIPATRTFMLSEYTDDMASMFEEGVDAEFFRSANELVEKAHKYAQYDTLREKVANNGYHRVVNDGHDVVSRMEKMVQIVLPYCASKGKSSIF